MNLRTQFIKVLCKLCYVGGLAAFLFVSHAQAVSGRTTYQAKIYKPDGLPLENPNVNFRFTVLDPSASCVLYIEDYAAVNMAGSAGLMSLTLGMGTKAFPVSGPATFATVFDNAIPSFNCQTPGVYNPVPTDNRKIVMQFNDGSGWQTLPAMAINAVPYAMYAGKSDNSLMLNGKADTSFVEYSTLATLNCANDEAIKFNGVSFSCIQVGSSGSVTSSTVVTALGYTPADGASVTALTANVFSVSSTVTTLESSVTSLSSTVAASFAAITSSQWSNVASGISYSGGNVGIGTNSPLTDFHISKTAATGTITTVGVTVTGSGTNFLSAFNPGDYLAIDAGPATAQIASIESDTSLTLTAPLWFGNLTNPFPIKRVGAIFNNGNVGIGTTGPLSPLHVSRSDINATAVATFQNPAASSVVLIKGANTNDAGGILEFHRSSSPIARMQAAQSTSGHYIRFAFYNGGTGQMDERLRITSSGNVGIGTSAPTARLHLAAGTTTLAPLKFTSGTLLTSPQSGTIEYDGSQLYFTDGANTRRAIATNSNPGSFENTSSITNASGNITLSPNETTGSVVVSATTASTNSNTGSLVVKGGVGVAGDIYSAATINGVSVTASSGMISPYIAGSVVSGGALTLDSTTHVTKGNIFLAPNGGSVGIGTTTPARTFHVKGSALFERDNAHPQVVMKVNGPLSGGTQEYSFDVVHNTGEFRLTDRTNGSTVPLRLDRGTPARLVLDASGSTTIQGGNVGIGTSSPTRALHAVASSLTVVPMIERTSSATTGAFSTFDILSSTSEDMIDGFGPANRFLIKDSANVENPIAHIAGVRDGADNSGALFFSTYVSGASSVKMAIKSTGNVGIGTTTPAAKLEVAGATANCAAFGICVYENLAQSSNANQPVSGTLKISMPLSWNNTMMAVTISGYNYTSNTGAWEVVVGGYNWIAGNWVNTSVDVRGTPPFTSVRLAHDGTSNTILLGDTSTIWIYPKVAVTRMMATHGGAIKDWGSGWGISYITDETGISNVAQLTLRKVELANGNFGLGVLAPTARLHLAAGTSSNAPLKLSSGTLLSSPQSGTIEYDGSHLYFTDGANTRRAIATNSAAGSFDNTSLISNTSGSITLLPQSSTGSVIVSATTASTSSETGALVVKGGLGVAGTVNIAGPVNVEDSITVSNAKYIYSKNNLGNAGRVLGINNANGLYLGDIDNVASSTVFTSNGGDNYLSFSNSLGARLAVSGSAALSVLPNGNVGIGTMNPNANLEVNNSVATGSNTLLHVFSPNIVSGAYTQMRLGVAATANNSAELRFYNANGSGSASNYGALAIFGQANPSLTFNGSGNVGVGTATPTAKLHVAGTAILGDTMSTTSVGRVVQVYTGNTANANSGLDITRSATATYGTAASQLSLRLRSDAGGVYRGSIGFADSDTAPETMTFTAAGNVGVGTANPQFKLDVSGTTRLGGFNESDSDQWPNVVWLRNTANNWDEGLMKAASTKTPFGKGGFAIHFDDSKEFTFMTSSYTPVAAFDGATRRAYFAGNVGVGTTNPVAPLDVSGTIRSAIASDGNFLTLQRTTQRIHYVQGIGQLLKFTSDSANTYDFQLDALNRNIYMATGGGNVGIGTSNPTTKLSILASDYTVAEFKTSDSASGPHIELKTASETAVLSSIVSNYGVPHRAGAIEYRPFANGRHNFYDGTGINTTNLKMTILASGNVGIGTISPTTKLTIRETGAALRFESTTENNDNSAKIVFAENTTDENFVLRYDGGAARPGSGVLTFTGMGIGDIMSLTRAGNVGIGTTSPSGRLHVSATTFAEVPLLQRAGQTTDTSVTAARILATKTTDMGDGFGSLLNFSIQDDLSSMSSIADIGAIRSGSDDSGNIIFRPYVLGVATERVRVTSGGNVGIGTSAPTQRLHVVGNLRVQGSTDCTLGDGAGGTNCSSDVRLKENIKPIPYALDKVLSLKGVEFDWNQKSLSYGRHDIGVIAQDVEKVFPTAVVNDQNTGYKKVDYAVLVAPVIEAVKALYQRLVGVERTVASVVAEKADQVELINLRKRTVELEIKAQEIDTIKAENAALKSYLCSKDSSAPICK